VDLTPQGIIERFDLFRSIYSGTTNYGHFGRGDLPWEQDDLF
jgi:S-adenosylmethionine synthetase